MRRWMLSLVVLSLLVSMIGCRHLRPHSHGVCDCEHDDHCASRSPWLRMGTGTPEQAPTPMKLPDVKSKL